MNSNITRLGGLRRSMMKFIFCLLWILLVFVVTLQCVYLASRLSNYSLEVVTYNNNTSSDEDDELDRVGRPQPCTSKQRETIFNQLPPENCNLDKAGEAYRQQCSLTSATKCPDATWLTKYYKDLNRTEKFFNEDFVAVYVGCNKGYDALNALRMGTGDAKYNKKDWHLHFNETAQSVCNQNEEEFAFIPPEMTTTSTPIVGGHVHCIEPMPMIIDRLNHSVATLGWDDTFFVTGAAISNKNSEQYFLEDELGNIGRENLGLENDCIIMREKEDHPSHHLFDKLCKVVNVFTLDYYMSEVSKKKSIKTVNILSIDVEGFDFDVIQGGVNTLKKTEYLEFEYNWMGSWSKQKLAEAISRLDYLGFSCYWAGVDNLWRIDESCWLEHYEYHTWSNVACVNRNLNSVLVENMEDIFFKTLKKNISYSYST